MFIDTPSQYAGLAGGKEGTAQKEILPTPTQRFTAGQLAAVARVASTAREASKNAAAQVEAVLAGEEFRKYWRELVGAELADLPAPELLDRIREGTLGIKQTVLVEKVSPQCMHARSLFKTIMNMG